MRPELPGASTEELDLNLAKKSKEHTGHKKKESPACLVHSLRGLF